MKTNVKKKYFAIIAIILTLFMSLLIIFPSIKINNQNTQVVSSTEKQEEKIANLTEDLYPTTNEKGWRVTNYANYEYAQKATIKYDAAKVKYQMQVNGNDKIISLVPEEMFT